MKIKNLIALFLDGEKQAFDKLVLKYKNMIYNLCFRILNNQEDAEDCFQETFIKVFKSLNSFQFKSAFSTWLYRIAINTCKNKVSSLEYKVRKLFNGNKNDCNSNYDEIKDTAKGSFEKIAARQTEESILKAITALDPEKRILITLKDIEDKSYEEIKDITGLKIGTIKSKLFRTREELKVKLKGKLE